MANSMYHWNGSQICAIDTETTGLNPHFHEIIQLCILPLDSNLYPRQDVLPFYVEIIPENPERIDPEAMKVNKLNLEKLLRNGFDQEKVKDLLEQWIEKLGLPYTKYGNRKKIIPLGQNYAFDKAFIINWLGAELYNEFFHYHHRDTMCAAAYLNDKAAMHAEKVPFSKLKLTWLAYKLNIEYNNKHDALDDCRVTAEVYRKLLKRGLFS